MQKKFLLLVGVLLCGNLLYGSGLSENEKKEMLSLHNDVREVVNVAPLVWSETLEKYSESWLSALAKKGCQMKHKYGLYGENIYWKSALDWGNGEKTVASFSVKRTVMKWANEKDYYTYKTNSCERGRVCTHYTQMVWRKTTQVGCARVICSNKEQLSMCSYHPHGNETDKDGKVLRPY